MVKAFRLRGRTLFLTYPRCSTDKKVVEENCEEKWGDKIEALLISREPHKDGEHHLHVCLQFFVEIDCTDALEYDALAGKHGNYQTCRSIKSVMGYVAKYDTECIMRGKAAMYISGQSTKADLVMKMINEDKSIEEITLAFPGYILQNEMKVEQYIRERRRRFAERDAFEDWTQLLLVDWQRPVLERLLIQDRRTVMWIHGSGDQHKTVFAKYLVVNHKAVILTANKHSDMIKCYKNEPIVVINLTKTMEGDYSKYIYGICEGFKDGILCDSKYNSVMKYFKSAKVVVLANFKPLIDGMGINRFDIVDVDELTKPKPTQYYPIFTKNVHGSIVEEVMDEQEYDEIDK